ncbi:MAG: hypothetical protein J07HQW2_02061 [Haloquadratum walsbyi J07HQW2]|uniref:Uncharacterized protein n=1 Tax=Haloquadratum walsbyi J07HQW2 TaxID=1238425 RepID=U1PPD1_9EURY|nr:MAG: hypothetical protein J07HQW2_02061 [Haloquadratum walsbyi J07HQW2]
MVVPLPVRPIVGASLPRSADRASDRAIAIALLYFFLQHVPRPSNVTVRVQLAVIIGSEIGTHHRPGPVNVFRLTLWTLATRTFFTHSFDGDADISECEFESIDKLPVTPERVCFLFTVDDRCAVSTSDRLPTYTVSTFRSSSHSTACFTTALRLWSRLRVRSSYTCRHWIR